MKNSINWYVNKKTSRLYIRYRINGKVKDETLHNLDYFVSPSQVKEAQINKKSLSILHHNWSSYSINKKPIN